MLLSGFRKIYKLYPMKHPSHPQCGLQLYKIKTNWEIYTENPNRKKQLGGNIATKIMRFTNLD